MGGADGGDAQLTESIDPATPSPAAESAPAETTSSNPGSLLTYFGGRSIGPRPAADEPAALPPKTRTRRGKHDPKQSVLFAASPAPSAASDASVASTAPAAGPSTWQLGVQESAPRPARTRKRAKPDEEEEIKFMAPETKGAKRPVGRPRKVIPLSQPEQIVVGE